MKKTRNRTLPLATESLRKLTANELERPRGGHAEATMGPCTTSCPSSPEICVW